MLVVLAELASRVHKVDSLHCLLDFAAAQAVCAQPSDTSRYFLESVEVLARFDHRSDNLHRELDMRPELEIVAIACCIHRGNLLQPAADA